MLVCTVCLAPGAESSAGTASADAGTSPTSTDLQAEGVAMITRLVEANHAWLVGPPEEVKNFSYRLERVSGTQDFEVKNPAKTPRTRLQGVTYWAMLQQLARAPQSPKILSLSTETNRVRLEMRFEPALRCAIGNGVENSWNGYHSFRGEEGVLLIDTNRWVPVETQIGRMQEIFGDVAEVSPGQYAPLKIHVRVGEGAYDWRFRVYEPGLWLFDDSYSDGRRLAWVENVSVNSAPPRVAHATESSVALSAASSAGREVLARFLDANRHWLLPPLKPRRGLVYDYRQEAPYLERIIINRDGNMLARLESSRESPGKPTRQQLRLADGRSYSGDVTNAFPKLDPAPAPDGKKGRATQRDRLVQHLAMGLALDCALTRLAREPDQFWAEVRPVHGDATHYLLVLHPKGDARLFTGTMLAFTSWAFMHDVNYSRSEILCEATTDRPVEEKDYAAKDELKGRYLFEDWLPDPSGAAPGLIRAVIPHEKDGKDESLEMEARFRFAKKGVWLLDQVGSQFRASQMGSTGTVQLVTAPEGEYLKVRELLRAAEVTDQLLASLNEAPQGGTSANLQGTNWVPALFRAGWTDKALEFNKGGESGGDEQAAASIIGLYQARILMGEANAVTVELEGVSTTSWKEFLSRWHVDLQDDQGGLLVAGSTNICIRANNGPTPFLVRMEMALPGAASRLPPATLRVEGTVERMTGMYHGHGMWMRYAER